MYKCATLKYIVHKLSPQPPPSASCDAFSHGFRRGNHSLSVLGNSEIKITSRHVKPHVCCCCWLLVTGCWLLVFDWSVVGCRDGLTQETKSAHALRKRHTAPRSHFYCPISLCVPVVPSHSSSPASSHARSVPRSRSYGRRNARSQPKRSSHGARDGEMPWPKLDNLSPCWLFVVDWWLCLLLLFRTRVNGGRRPTIVGHRGLRSSKTPGTQLREEESEKCRKIRRKKASQPPTNRTELVDELSTPGTAPHPRVKRVNRGGVVVDVVVVVRTMCMTNKSLLASQPMHLIMGDVAL